MLKKIITLYGQEQLGSRRWPPGYHNGVGNS
jgi:hypothetical protein